MILLFILVLSGLCGECFNDTPNLGINNGFGKRQAFRQPFGIDARSGGWFQHETGINGKKSQNAPRQGQESAGLAKDRLDEANATDYRTATSRKAMGNAGRLLSLEFASTGGK